MSTKRECPFCCEKKSAHFLLKHLLTQHPERLFDEDTQDGRLNRLHLKCSDRKPVHLQAKEVNLYCCLGCSAGINRQAIADQHFPKCAKAHSEALAVLKEKYPQTRPTFGKAGASGSAETDVSGAVVLTTTTTTTTRIEAPNPAVLAYVLKQLNVELAVSRDTINTKEKQLATLAKRYNIPQAEIDSVSVPTDSDCSDPEPDEDKVKVEYDKEPKVNLLDKSYFKRFAKEIGASSITPETLQEMTLQKLKEKAPELFSRK